MGIPSYYKRLIDRFPRLVQRGVSALSSDLLLMDFNCLIYQCVRAEGLPVYTRATRVEWETALIEAVKDYTVKVWAAAGKPGKVFIGVDGVVPMAKIRQQRVRRFKSVWLRKVASSSPTGGAGESWAVVRQILPSIPPARGVRAVPPMPTLGTRAARG